MLSFKSARAEFTNLLTFSSSSRPGPDMYRSSQLLLGHYLFLIFSHRVNLMILVFGIVSYNPLSQLLISISLILFDCCHGNASFWWNLTKYANLAVLGCLLWQCDLVYCNLRHIPKKTNLRSLKWCKKFSEVFSTSYLTDI